MSIKYRHMRHVMGCLLLGVVVGCAFAQKLAVPEPEPGKESRIAAAVKAPDQAEVLRLDRPPVLDGKLDEVFWQKAPAYGSMKTSDKGISSDTQFKLACDDAWLYVGVECRNENLGKIQDSVGPKVTGHDRGAAGDDSIEFFLDPAGDGKLYLHYMLSWAGAFDERRITRSGGREIGWNVPWRRAINVRRDGWSAELAFPLYEFAAYGDPGAFRFNLTRNKRLPDIDACGVVVSEKNAWRSFAPVVKTFHEPENFARLMGIPGEGLRTPFLMSLEGANLLPYRVEDGKTYYDVDVEARGYSFISGEARLVVLDRPVTGKATEATAELRLKGTEKVTQRISVPVAAMSERAITVQARDLKTGEIMGALEVEDKSALRIMTAYLDRSYYTTETQAMAVCSLGLPEKSLADFTLVAMGGSNTFLATAEKPAPETYLGLPLARLSQGVTPLTIELRRKSDNALFFECPLRLIRREPKPGKEWKIDRVNRVVLNNGKPFFPLAMVMSGVSYDNEKDFQRVAEAGFNTYLQWGGGLEPEDTAKFAAILEKYGMCYVDSPDMAYTKPVHMDTIDKYFDKKTAAEKQREWQRVRWLKGAAQSLGYKELTPQQQMDIFQEYYQKNLPRIQKAVATIRDNSQLSAYFILDEPWDAFAPIGRDLYRRIHELDGYHPVMVNFSSNIGKITDWFDVIMTDPYWSPGRAGFGIRSKPDFVAKITWMTYRRGEQYRQPCWQVPVGNYWSGMRKRALTRDEQLCQCYLATIYGASGLYFFIYPVDAVANWEALKEVCRQFKLIGPAACLPRVEQKIAYERAVVTNGVGALEYRSVVFDYYKDTYPEVHARLMRRPEGGGFLLLAASARYYPVTVNFNVSGLSGMVKRWFSDDTCAATNGTFADKIEPLGVRAYLLPELQAPLDIKLSISHRAADEPAPETSYAHDYRRGKKNELPNPGIEDATIKGWPDFWFPSSGHDMDRLAGSADPSWGQVAEQPHQGKYCLKLRYPRASTQIHCNPQHNKEMPYTISFWARASRPGIDMWLYPHQMERMAGVEYDAYKTSRTFKLSTEWRRYSLTAILPARVGTTSRLGNILEFRTQKMAQGDAVWLDAVQFEQGTSATEFEE